MTYIVPMNQQLEDSTELFLRFSRRNMFILLVVVLLLGAAALAVMLTPSGRSWRIASQAALLPVAIAIIAATLSSYRGRSWNPDAPEVKLVMNDEWRRTNMLRASRTALIVVLVAQWPLALLFGFYMSLPSPRQASAMAASSLTLGLATLLALFLFLDRE